MIKNSFFGFERCDWFCGGASYFSKLLARAKPNTLGLILHEILLA